MRTRDYINLSNGLEATIPGAPILRMCSTTLERRDWLRLFGVELTPDLLLHLALGTRCVIHDRGTLRKNSKTVYLGVPVVRYVLAALWFGREAPSCEAPGPRTDALVYDRFDDAREALAALKAPNAHAGRVRKDLRYYARYLRPGLREIRLEGHSVSTDRDGDRAYFAALAQNGAI